MTALIHYSDCAVNSGPDPGGPCDCGMLTQDVGSGDAMPIKARLQYLAGHIAKTELGGARWPAFLSTAAEAAAHIDDQNQRIAELEAALRELMLSGYERMGWHRTDKIVTDDAARIDDCSRALAAASAVLETSPLGRPHAAST